MEERLTFFGFRSLNGKNDSFVADSNPDCLSLMVYLIACDKKFDYSSIIVNQDIRPRKLPRKGALPFASFQSNRKNLISKFESIVLALGSPLDSDLNLSQLSVSNLICDTILHSCCWTISFEWRWKDKKMCEEITAPLYLSGLGLKPTIQKQVIKNGRKVQLRRLRSSGRKYYNMKDRSGLGKKDLRSIEDAMGDYNDTFIFGGDHPTSADCLLYGMSTNAIFTAMNYPIPKNSAEQMLVDGAYPKILRHTNFMTTKYINKLRQVVEPDFNCIIHEEEESIPVSALTEFGETEESSKPWYDVISLVSSFSKSHMDTRSSFNDDSRNQLGAKLVRIAEKSIETDSDDLNRKPTLIVELNMKNEGNNIELRTEDNNLKKRSAGTFHKVRKLIKSLPYRSMKKKKVEAFGAFDYSNSKSEHEHRVETNESLLKKQNTRKDVVEGGSARNEKKENNKRALTKNDLPEDIASFLILLGDDLSG